MGSHLVRLWRNLQPVRVGFAIGALIAVTTFPPTAQAADYSTSQVALSSSTPSTTSVSYTFTFSGVTTSAIKCLKVQFTTAIGSTSLPTGMSTASTTFGSTSNYVPTPASWTVDNASSASGIVKMTLSAGETPASASSRTVVLAGITNSSNAGTYYAVVNTYNNTDCSASAVDSGSVAFPITTGVSVSATVLPALTYTLGSTASCASLTLSVSAATTCSHTIAIATNASTGYTLSYGSTSTTLTNTRTGHTTETTAAIGATAATSSAGSEQFGINLASNSSPSVGAAASGGSGSATAPYATADNFALNPGSSVQVASSSGTSNTTTYTVSYLANIANSTEPGSYSASLVYNVTANY